MWKQKKPTQILLSILGSTELGETRQFGGVKFEKSTENFAGKMGTKFRVLSFKMLKKENF